VEIQKANGQDGGAGGSIFLVGDEKVNTVFHLKNTKNVIAEDGTNAAVKPPVAIKGKKGSDVMISVPLGSKIYDSNNKLICEIQDTKPFIIAKGGTFGFGNIHF
jgi:GTP-binding protein